MPTRTKPTNGASTGARGSDRLRHIAVEEYGLDIGYYERLVIDDNFNYAEC